MDAHDDRSMGPPQTGCRAVRSRDEPRLSRVERQADGARVSRGGLLARAFAGAGVLVGAGAGAAELAASPGSQSSPARDQEIFNFALTVERLQAAFYAAALRAGRLTGEARQFAEVAGAHEQAHLRYLLGVLGPHAREAPSFRFGDAVSDQSKFIATAVQLETTGLAAYNGQAPSLTPVGLAAAARIVSVESRHTAWARALDGEDPAPVAVDAPITASEATAAIRPFLA
jgi:hypothetical protein